MDELGLTAAHFEAMTANHPIGRLGNALDIAEAMFWLASPAAAFITGISMPVDGDRTAH
jgi:NAD(P)-dependent dehydrogenase (short-subunit alcohol dehydrogenase family)